MRTINSSTTSTVSELRSKGVSYENGKLKITTDQAPPSRQEYIASTQRAFEKGAKQMSLHPEAFKTGPNRESSAERTEDAIAEGKSSSVDTPFVAFVAVLAMLTCRERKAFQRPKKLD